MIWLIFYLTFKKKYGIMCIENGKGGKIKWKFAELRKRKTGKLSGLSN
jgi:hypothetical protein